VDVGARVGGGPWTVGGTVGSAVGGTAGRHGNSVRWSLNGWSVSSLSSKGMTCCVWGRLGLAVVAVSAPAVCGVGKMLNRHMRAPEISRNPWRTTVPAVSTIETFVLVNTTLQPASQNWPMLIRLLTKDGMMMQSSVFGGRFGRRSLPLPLDVMRSPLAMLTVVGWWSA